ncbi:MAG: hypothetical protein LBH56_01150 [Coriobacteriales bacterium]|jgi:hypothetical protein|nr:hypothetical protein [Coriobacteriales bacterium]
MQKACKVLLITFIAIGYAAAGVVFLYFEHAQSPQSSQTSGWLGPAMFALPILMTLVGIVCIVCVIIDTATSRKHLEQRGSLLKSALVSKLLIVPLSILSVLIGGLLLLYAIFGVIAPPLGPILWMMLAPYVVAGLVISTALGILCLVVPSLYYISALIDACRRGQISKIKLALFIILIIIPVVDVIFCAFIYAHLKNPKKWQLIVPSAICALVLLALCILAAIFGITIASLIQEGVTNYFIT